MNRTDHYQTRANGVFITMSAEERRAVTQAAQKKGFLLGRPVSVAEFAGEALAVMAAVVAQQYNEQQHQQ